MKLINRPFSVDKKTHALWIIVITINIVVGTAIGIVRLTIGNVNKEDQPSFIVLSQQTKQSHETLSKKINHIDNRVDMLEQRVNKLDETIQQHTD